MPAEDGYSSQYQPTDGAAAGDQTTIESQVRRPTTGLRYMHNPDLLGNHMCLSNGTDANDFE